MLSFPYSDVNRPQLVHFLFTFFSFSTKDTRLSLPCNHTDLRLLNDRLSLWEPKLLEGGAFYSFMVPSAMCHWSSICVQSRRLDVCFSQQSCFFLLQGPRPFYPVTPRAFRDLIIWVIIIPGFPLLWPLYSTLLKLCYLVPFVQQSALWVYFIFVTTIIGLLNSSAGADFV